MIVWCYVRLLMITGNGWCLYELWFFNVLLVLIHVIYTVGHWHHQSEWHCHPPLVDAMAVAVPDHPLLLRGPTGGGLRSQRKDPLTGPETWSVVPATLTLDLKTLSHVLVMSSLVPEIRKLVLMVESLTVHGMTHFCPSLAPFVMNIICKLIFCMIGWLPGRALGPQLDCLRLLRGGSDLPLHKLAERRHPAIADTLEMLPELSQDLPVRIPGNNHYTLDLPLSGYMIYLL